MELDFVLRLLQSIFAFYGLVYLVSSMIHPAWFLDNLAVDEFEKRHNARNPFGGRQLPIRYYAKFVLAGLGIGVIAYSAMDAALSAMPYSWGWGSYDDDAEGLPIGLMIQFMGVIAITGALLPNMEKNAKARIMWGIETLSRSALQEAITDSWTADEKVLKAAHHKIESKLKLDEFAGVDWSASAQKEHQKKLLLSIETARKLKSDSYDR